MSRCEAAKRFEGKSVAIVGSGPGSIDNAPGLVDGHDVVVRVNNYKLVGGTGSRCDVFYSYFGTSIKKKKEDLKRDGVTFCMSKVPNAHAIESEWHRKNHKMIGVDYRPHYERRKNWWFCDTYVPSVEEFMVGFRLLGDHQPTSGFAAILDIVSFNPRSVFLTGFDFFSSKIHDVDQPWNQKNSSDPIGHVPERERQWLKDNMSRYPISVDAALAENLAAA